MTECPQAGPDPRRLDWLICPLQDWLKFRWKSEPVPSLTLALVPPLLVVNFPLFWRKAEAIPGALATTVPVLHLRAGWRRDMNFGVYLLTFAAKVEPRTQLW